MFFFFLVKMDYVDVNSFAIEKIINLLNPVPRKVDLSILMHE